MDEREEPYNLPVSGVFFPILLKSLAISATFLIILLKNEA